MLQKSFCLAVFLSFLFSSMFAKSQEELTAEADSLKTAGSKLFKMLEYDQALSIFTQELKIREQLIDSVGKAKSYHNIGLIYHYKGDNDNALKYYMKSLEINLKVFGSDHLDVAKSYNNIGVTFLNKGDYEQALEFHKKALEIRLRLFGHNHLLIAKSFNNIGIVYRSLA